MTKYIYKRYAFSIKYTNNLPWGAYKSIPLFEINDVKTCYTGLTFSETQGYRVSGTSSSVVKGGYMWQNAKVFYGKYAYHGVVEILHDTFYDGGKQYHKWRELNSTLSAIQGAYINDIIAEDGTYPLNGPHSDGYWYVRHKPANSTPTMSDMTENNKIFYEGDTISINGSATDNDNGNIVSVKYKINNGTIKAIATGISDGTTPIAYSKTLKYTNGKLLDGVTEVATGLVDGQTYSITIWSEDDQGGKSTEVVRSFTVVPNRAPVLTIDPITSQTNKINSEVITLTGNVTDADGNDVTVDIKINDNASKQIYSGAPSTFSTDIKIADLIEGNNSITVTSKDTFDFVTTKTITLNKARNATKLNKAIARYKVNPPAGSAKQILSWIQKETGDLTVDADISMVLANESENYSPMTKLTAPINDSIEEDEFAYEALAEKDNITLKLKLSKTDANSTKAIKQISGVLK